MIHVEAHKADRLVRHVRREPGDEHEDNTCDRIVQSAQNVVAAKQDALQKALQELSTTLTAAVKVLGDTTTTPSTDTPATKDAEDTHVPEGTKDVADTEKSEDSSGSGGTATPKTSGSGASLAAAGGGGPVTAASLARDQAAIDTAKAERTEARRARASAELTSPFGGEILSVSVAKGDSVGESTWRS